MARDLPTADAIQGHFRNLDFNRVHTRHVAALAVSLFDQTRRLHGMDDSERLVLWYAGLLHDVGQGVDYAAHHKHSMALILDCQEVDLDAATQRMVACVARYHRRARPKKKHPIYGDLPEHQRDAVKDLAALLRIGDGLDRGQVGRVEELRVARLSADNMLLRVYSPQPPNVEIAAGRKKAGLFERVFGLSVLIEYGGKRPEG
jgi:exopolyphosphatase/guanosine-5'-triphosphate,3'-diphosphate pyrophosphatase